MVPRWIFNWTTVIGVIYVGFPLLASFLGIDLPDNGLRNLFGRPSENQTNVLPYTSTPYVVTPSDFSASSFTATPYPTYTSVPTASAYPTYTPGVGWAQGSVTATPNAFEPYQINWAFSYYDPDLVSQRDINPQYEVNCHVDNWIWNDQGTKVIGCKDITASGEKWSEFFIDQTEGYRGGVAVPYHPDTCQWDEATHLIIDMEFCQPIYPMYAVIHVSAPVELEGDYLVIDICPACFAYVHTNSVLFLDFLAEGLPHNVNFWDKVQVDSVRYP